MLVKCRHAKETRQEDADLDIITSVEGFQVKLLPWLGGPQAQVDCVVGLEARDGVVICDGSHLCKTAY